MNGGPRGAPGDEFLAKNVDQMENVNPYRNGIPKDLPNRSKDSHWVKEVDEKEAEENLSLYCKPVELYNIIQQRCEHQPLFLQRCLSYKINAAWQRRIRMDISITACSMSKLKGKDPVPSSGSFDRPVFVMVTRPTAYPTESGVFQGQVAYQLKVAQVLDIQSLTSSESTAQSGVTFILPELKKLEQNAKSGDVILFIVFDSVDIQKDRRASFWANCSGRVVWGKLAILSLCLQWMRNAKDNGPRGLLDGTGVVTSSNVDLRHGILQHEDSTAGKIIKLSAAKATTEKSLVQLQVRVVGAEVGQTIAKDKTSAGTVPRNPVPYSLSHTWRPRFGRVVFHYLYYHGILRKTEVTEDFSCPFCLNGCASFQGLRRHLNASHDLFNFEYLVSGELQVVNVSCRPEVGNIRDVDGLSDPRVKNFTYWFKGSHHRRRRVPKVLVDQGLDTDGQAVISWVDATPQDAVEQSPIQSSVLHQKEDLHDEAMDNGTVECTDEVMGVVGAEVEVASTSAHHAGDSLVNRKSIQFPNGLNITFPNGIEDDIQKKEIKHGDMTSQQDHKNRLSKLQDTDSLAMVGKRSTSALKRQRMKDVMGERALAGTRPTSTFGGACASAGGGQDLEDCGAQQSLSVPNKIPSDRPDMLRTHSQLQKRQYFHSHTAQPMDLDDLLGDRDSEDEVDTAIAELEDRRMLDDFVDVTPEEKEVMHLWNSFVRRNRVVADGHCPWACGEFSRENAQRFGENPALRRCLMLFLVKLWNHHLVDGPTIHQCLAIVDVHEPK